MKRRRRCLICVELFTPDPRVGSRHRACSRPACQRERHRLACIRWRKAEKPAEEEARFRGRLGSPEGQLRLQIVRDECGMKTKVLIEELAILMGGRTRDECPGKRKVRPGKVLILTSSISRDERVQRGLSP